MKPGTKKDEILALTGIRALAAVWVVGFHFYTVLALLFPSLSELLAGCFKSGHLGVDLFFVLSGFIIAYNYQDRLYPFRLQEYKKFLWARLSRLYPVHLATLLGCLGLYTAARIGGVHLNTAGTNWGGWDFFTNLFMVHAWTMDGHSSWNFPSWSISCEWLAYLFFPAVCVLAVVKWRASQLWLIVGGLLLGLSFLHFAEWKGLRVLFMGIAFEFPAGVCMYQLYKRRKADGRPPSSIPIQPIILLAAAATMTVASKYNTNDALLIPLLAMLVYSVAIDSQAVFSRLLASRFAMYWGRVSYSLYMTHAVTSMVMIRLLPLVTFADRSLVFRVGVCVVYFSVMALVAALTYHFIEEPARKWMRERSPVKS